MAGAGAGDDFSETRTGPARSILVLNGGPDREAPISRQSGTTVAEALAEAGHDVTRAEIHPDDLSALDQFEAAGGELVFPVLHGPWGEGGGLQAILESRPLPFVGCRAAAARLAMDKHATKRVVEPTVATPASELLTAGKPLTLSPPLVLKPPQEGSSIGIAICRDEAEVAAARQRLERDHPMLLAEVFVEGRELTVGVIETGDDPEPQVLPAIEICTATSFYDYEAKYERDDTTYHPNPDLPPGVEESLRSISREVFARVECRHLARIDFILDSEGKAWFLEVNTMPGFTSHSLLPQAAVAAGWTLPGVLDAIIGRALAGETGA
ncbi:MAG: D-alanine--D-alanine ligase [Phycisphaeraceae bacterium]|nr:D-alanine--D-alanine ligase [Phycisphaeraceae bacterium]